MTPNDAGQLAATFGPTAAILLVMYLNRKPDKDTAKDPLNEIKDLLKEILWIVKDKK